MIVTFGSGLIVGKLLYEGKKKKGKERNDFAEE